MDEKEIREKYKARILGSQIEFNRLMGEMNHEQECLNIPYLNRYRELIRQRELLKQQKDAINIQLRANGIEIYDIEQQRKDINRLFHELKHDIIMVNPRDIINENKL